MKIVELIFLLIKGLLKNKYIIKANIYQKLLCQKIKLIMFFDFKASQNYSNSFGYLIISILLRVDLV